MAGSGRTGAAQHGACKGMEEQSRQGTGRGAGGAGQEEKEKGGAGDQEGFGCLYRVVESFGLRVKGRVRVGLQVGDAGLGLRGSDCGEKKKRNRPDC